jgi:hypothetical protein
MKYYLFIDESGDHGLKSIDESFPVFVLCGILFSEPDYFSFKREITDFKLNFWGNKNVIFHSRDIRKCQKEFQILFDNNVKLLFYNRLNNIITAANFTIIASVINKIEYIKKFGKLADDPYEISLSFLIESSIYLLDSFSVNDKELKIMLEKRGKLEDNKLASHFSKLKDNGTFFVDSSKLKNYNTEIFFKHKKDNVLGLELSDLIAYPIAKYVLDKSQTNPAFDIIADKFYNKFGKRFGLNIFP